MEHTQTLKRTALSEIHIALGAKMVPFAGYLMPVQYAGLVIEHEAVRNALGVFDVSHMGEFIIKGNGALKLIQQVTSNDASVLTKGKIQYSCLPNLSGGIVDDLLVYRIAEEEYMLVVNASNIEKDWNWIQQFNHERVEMKNISDEVSLLAVQGPKAAEALQPLTDISLSDMAYYTFQRGIFAGCNNVIISATGYTGAGGFEVYCRNDQVLHIWNEVLRVGKPFGIQPAGLGCRDTLRLEMGFCLYGNDIDDTTSPIEAGLGWITKFNNPFNNSEYLEEQRLKGVKRRLVGLEMLEKGGIPRHGHDVVDERGNKIGVVTSGSPSPTLKKSIALAYVPAELSKPGSEVFVSIRDKALKAVVVRTPFK